MRRLTLLSIALLLAWSEPAPAQGAQDTAAGQTPTSLCYHARPKPACSAFIFTNFGGYLVLGTDETGATPLREVADWGLMFNVGTRDAIGASAFASLDRLVFAVGPALRYRRWITPSKSVEVAIGKPLLLASNGDIIESSVFGLVRWSPNHWFAVAARPELLRRTVFVGCGVNAYCPVGRSRGRVSLGVEFGRVPGLALTVAGGIATLVAAIAAIGN